MLIYAFDSVIRFKKSRDLHDIHVRHKIVHTDVHVHAMMYINGKYLLFKIKQYETSHFSS